MAQHWASKAPAEVVQRKWTIPVDEGDSVTGYTAVVTDATKVSDERNGNVVIVTISAGTNGDTAIASLTATTAKGLTLVETFYLPIREDENAFSQTVGEVVAYALRPVVGMGEVATADEQSDALEAFGDMVAEWAESGADLGVRLPPLASDVIYSLDSHVSAMKAALRVKMCEQYGVQVKTTDAIAAVRGMQRVKNSLLPDERPDIYY